MLGIVKNTLAVTVLDYLARLHHNDLIGDVGHDGEIVADEHHADIARFVNSQCDYFTEVSWPENEYLDVGVRVNKLGRSSVQYAAALFTPENDLAVAQGTMTHVWVDRVSRAAVSIPDDIRTAMEAILYKEQ